MVSMIKADAARRRKALTARGALGTRDRSFRMTVTWRGTDFIGNACCGGGREVDEDWETGGKETHPTGDHEHSPRESGVSGIKGIPESGDRHRWIQEPARLQCAWTVPLTPPPASWGTQDAP